MIPNKIKVGGIKFKTFIVKHLKSRDDTKLNGWIKYDPSKILLNKKLGKQNRRVVLWHEILHAILEQAGFQEHDETQLIALSYGIVQVLRDNPDLRNLK